MKNNKETLIKALATNPVKTIHLLEEIQLLLKDYFEGELFLNGKELLYQLPNGQKFLLSIEEIT